jgi:hypothetical protein
MKTRSKSESQRWPKIIAALGLVSIASGCGKSSNFSLLSQSQNFQQANAQVNNKVDVLWVVDNSSSMDPLQANLVANFNTFIQNFKALGFDYKMAVTTTDAYLSEAGFNNTASLAKFRDGQSSPTGYYYIMPSIPNIVTNFVTNATVGASGSGDERAFQSMYDALQSPLNSDFRRPEAFFAVVILSDEDDFTDATRPEASWLKNGGIPDHDYSNPNLPSVASVANFLDQYTGSTTQNRNYNVSAITITNSACQQSHVTASPTTIIGQRYIDLANSTNGVVGSICDPSYANSLAFIQQRIVELTTQFRLAGSPDPTSIQVYVNGALIPQDANNGWTYSASSNSIVFHGDEIPPSQASINVTFNPSSLQ